MMLTCSFCKVKNWDCHKHRVEQKVLLGFPTRSYGKAQMNFLANPVSLGRGGAEPVNEGACVARSLAGQHAMLRPTVSGRRLS